ncbi:hypothetical protein [Paenibacillus sp. CF384]|uniref:hypothetical protein n=1 Tax=Paenibacillus sp. CF384 TaxID=1884382 RepID=UPI000896E06F|nr:hypothetical protein [Paenibacillus sp. CF384]SDW23095.1 hypothetical protein SAMN05518855_1001735 [Paenibacillus sp. CF384]
MKKTWIWIVALSLISCAGLYYYFQLNGPKIVQGSAALSESVDVQGKPIAPSKTFSSKAKALYVSAKFKRFIAKGATVRWYKGETIVENRIKVDENIKLSKAGYAYSKLTAPPEGFTPGDYSVIVYSAGNDVSEATIYFKINEQ